MPATVAERLRSAYGESLRTKHDEGSFVPEPGTSDLPGHEIETAAGRCLLYEERYPLDHRHGGTELGACLELPPLAVACLARRRQLDALDLRQAIFLDTETTGLAGGTGTTAFLVGIGYFERVGAQFIAPYPVAADEGAMNCAPTTPNPHHPQPTTYSATHHPTPTTHFVIRQFFMRDFAEERAMLLALAEALERFRYVVTFNGKSFDWPLLETRYVLARLACPRPPELHLDLLHPSRRLWREQLESCSLGVLEEAILGHRRDLDVPSWAIPGLYAAFLRYGEAGPLRRVFTHNRHDLLSLVTLASQLGRRLADPLTCNLGALELLAIARLYEEIGSRDEACACLEVALEHTEQPLRGRVQLLLALYCKRAGHRERAFELWRELTLGPQAPISLVELAKHHEHQRRDPNAALAVVERALAALELREARDGSVRWRAERADLEKRLARLLRKRGSGAARRAPAIGVGATR